MKNQKSHRKSFNNNVCNVFRIPNEFAHLYTINYINIINVSAIIFKLAH